MCQISKKLFCLSFKLKKKLKKSENLFCAQKPPIFGTKVDFFPLSEKKSKNFPNTKKIILAELHFKKIKKKIRETFWSAPFYHSLRSLCFRVGASQVGAHGFRTFFVRCRRPSLQNVQD